MELRSTTGDSLELHIDGYQFPEADDPGQRYSWHMVSGRAHSRYGEWSFRWQALTCDESPRISEWLRRVADWIEANPRTGPWKPDETVRRRPTQELWFTEPNLRFSVEGESEERAILRVDLDCEFRPPWHLRPGGYGGDEYPLRLLMAPDDLRRGAGEWDLDVDRFPDLSA